MAKQQVEIHDQSERVPIEQLKPYENNPKQHSPEKIARLAKSIAREGFMGAIVIDGDNTVVAGHARLEAAKQLGMVELPCINRGDLSEERIRAMRIADNKLAESPWDYMRLIGEVEALVEADIDIEETAFELEEIDEIYERIATSFEPDPGDEHLRPELKDKGLDQGPAGDNNWFFITYYGNPDIFEELLAKMKQAGIMKTNHEICGQAFKEMLEVYLNGKA